jgi:hypothetical protein
VQRRQHQQRALQVVFRQDHDRSIGVQAAREEAGGERAHARERLGVRERVPRAGLAALGQEHAVGHGGGPVNEALGQAGGVGGKGFGRAERKVSSRTAIDHGFRGAEVNGAVALVHGRRTLATSSIK